MRVGIFGGTFDPVHLGHLILAEQCREQGRLDQVWFVPAPRPPHKHDQSLTRFDQRVEMIQLAIAGQPAFRVEEIEKERAGPSYTVDTVAELRRRHPADEFSLLVGSDTLAEMHTWYEPARLLSMVGLLVMTRPGHPTRSADQIRTALNLSTPVRVDIVEAPLIDIASRDLRSRAATGRSLRYLLPRARRDVRRGKAPLSAVPPAAGPHRKRPQPIMPTDSETVCMRLRNRRAAAHRQPGSLRRAAANRLSCPRKGAQFFTWYPRLRLEGDVGVIIGLLVSTRHRPDRRGWC